MTFREAVTICFRKYAVFDGRGSRAEYWYFFLFGTLVQLICWPLDYGVSRFYPTSLFNAPISMITSAALFIPSMSAFVRRLHDADHTGWWVGILITSLSITQIILRSPAGLDRLFRFGMILSLVSFGILVLCVIWLASPGTSGANRFGDDVSTV